jgi:hypothetical protein
MVAEPGCWHRFGLLQVRLLSVGLKDSVVVDAYAAQHPANAHRDRRQRQSVAVHLVALCLHHELGVGIADLLRLRGRTSSTVLPFLRVDDWPALTPPPSWGELNSLTVMSVPDRELPDAIREWPREVWRSWSAQHAVVRGWAEILLGGEHA